jgi:hypothetical protein
MPDTFIKDPEAVLDYEWNWANWLQEGEIISTAAVVVAGVSPELVCDDFEHMDNTVTCWLSGGSEGAGYAVVCTVTTNQDRTEERTIYIVVQNR